MAISGQETLQIGAQNSPTNSDSLWTAFNKTQNNFSTLFSEASPYNVFNGAPGIGVTANSTSGVVTITNTGVLNLVQGTGITLSGANGNIVVSATGGNGTAGVTSVGIVSNSLSITNTPIVSAGNINVDLPLQSNVSAGVYGAPTVTVDQYGRITNIANASSFGTVTSVAVSGGTGIGVSGGPITTNGTITLTNTGVTRLTAGSGIVLTDSTGNITITATAATSGGSANAAGSTGQIQYNLSGTFNASANLSYDSSNNILNIGSLEATGDLLPSANITYDLGSPTKRWKDLYLSNNSILLGESTISVDGGALTVNGNPPDAVFESVSLGEGSGVDWARWDNLEFRFRGPDANLLATLQKVNVGMKIKLLTPSIVANTVLTTTSRLELKDSSTPDHYEYAFSVAEPSGVLQSQDVYSAEVAYTNTLSLASNGNIVLPGSDSSITYIDGSLAAPQIIGVPANATANGVPGQTAFDSNYIYICTAVNTWKRAAISTW